MSDREKIKRLRIIVEQLAFNHNLDFKMLHASIIALLDMIDDFLKEEELTEEQQEIYEYFKQGYKEFDDEDESINDTMEDFSIALGGKDEDIVPALKKFLSEVEE
ncbi:hypothetical protein [Tetragenococcus halophilus]|uniref:Uncharacterized protein n=1 Tax=Tetragenococcus halophilus (strain DSM 20338 / JCM 20259 / NCIMB 9735 / NBRC 12172) TaxID=945021 RepID=A0AAN1VSC9_TETHN|nr:hypothetical protein [Tetragenococcus halophilus]BAK95146.1 hypothetical protein TEH_18190 [Tetragenococcus halophilus NBRC 12172]GBD71108.1 putative uncharacterized protein [Tetragenococcus halophilus subsp. halophilus]